MAKKKCRITPIKFKYSKFCEGYEPKLEYYIEGTMYTGEAQAQDTRYRYQMGCRQVDGINPLVVIGMNPSCADMEYADRTVKRVIEISMFLDDVDGWMMFNLYPERATNCIDLKMKTKNEDQEDQEDQNVREKTKIRNNIEILRNYLDNNKNSSILLAWGNLRIPLLREAKEEVLKLLSAYKDINLYCVGSLTGKGNPRHLMPRVGNPMKEVKEKGSLSALTEVEICKVSDARKQHCQYKIKEKTK